MASIILVKECTVRSADNFPLPIIYSPVGSISTPCGDLGVGRKYTAPGTLVGSIMSTSSFMVVVAVWVCSSYTLCAYLVGVFVAPPFSIYSSILFQFTAAIKSLSFWDGVTSSKEWASSIL